MSEDFKSYYMAIISIAQKFNLKVLDLNDIKLVRVSGIFSDDIVNFVSTNIEKLKHVSAPSWSYNENENIFEFVWEYRNNKCILQFFSNNKYRLLEYCDDEIVLDKCHNEYADTIIEDIINMEWLIKYSEIKLKMQKFPLLDVWLSLMTNNQNTGVK